MATEEIHDRRRMFELFTALKVRVHCLDIGDLVLLMRAFVCRSKGW
jgi:hypothetical protein